MKKIFLSITLLIILSSCINQLKDKSSHISTISNKLKKSADNTLLVLIDSNKVGTNVSKEISNALQLSFLNYENTKNQMSKGVSEISIETLSQKQINNLYSVYNKYKKKNVTNIISFLNDTELNKIPFFFKNAQIYSIHANTNISGNIRSLKNNIKAVFPSVINILRNSNKILFVDHNDKVKNKLDKSLANINFSRDLMVDYICFESVDSTKFQEILHSQNIDTVIFNISTDKTNSLFDNSDFNGKVILLNPNDINLSNLPNYEDFYFAFIDLELFKEFSNSYTSFFNKSTPSLYSYVVYKLSLLLLKNKNINTDNIPELALYHKIGSKIIRN